MAPSTLFDLVLKVLGIFFIRDILETLSRTLSVLVYFPQYNSTNEAFFNLGVTIPPLVLYTVFAWLLLFRTESLVKWLKIEKHLGDQPVTINFPRSAVLTTAVLITGGWLLVSEIPEFFRHSVYYYQERVMYDRMVRPDYSYPLMSLLKIIIAIGLIVFHTPFVHLIESLSKNRLHMKWWGKRGGKTRRENRDSTMENRQSTIEDRHT